MADSSDGQTRLPLMVGDEASLDVLITPAMVRAFIAVCGDDAPLHTDPAFARALGFKGPLVHGALLAACVSRLVGTRLPGSHGLLERMDLGFRSPCSAPVRLRLVARVRQVSEAVASVVLDVTITTDPGVVVATGRTWHRLLGRARS